ncbi:MAG TPA: hypothetical protein VHZ56_14055, partial [Devosia sp.]|nr:hypothetical protein [Devosia sp.]
MDDHMRTMPRQFQRRCQPDAIARPGDERNPAALVRDIRHAPFGHCVEPSRRIAIPDRLVVTARRYRQATSAAIQFLLLSTSAPALIHGIMP